MVHCNTEFSLYWWGFGNEVHKTFLVEIGNKVTRRSIVFKKVIPNDVIMSVRYFTIEKYIYQEKFYTKEHLDE